MSMNRQNLGYGGATIAVAVAGTGVGSLVDVGGTQDAAVLSRQPEHLTVQPEQAPNPHDVYMTSEVWTVAWTYLEVTPTAINEAMLSDDGALADGAAFGGTTTPTEMEVSVTVTGPLDVTYVWFFESVYFLEPGDLTYGRSAPHSLGAKGTCLGSHLVADLGQIGTLDSAA